MSATPTEEQIQDQVQDANTTEASAETAAAEQAFEGEDLSIPEDVPTADDPSSRATSRSLDDAGFTIDEFAALLSKYCLLYTSPSPRDAHESRMPSSA